MNQYNSIHLEDKFYCCVYTLFNGINKTIQETISKDLLKFNKNY